MGFNRIEPNPRIVEGEHEILAFWEKSRTFDQLRKKNEGREPWSFLDGPITANNPMGVHHAWGRTYKDAFQRYFAMRGFDQRWQNGFDCQGLWVEVQVERELGFNSKRDIEAFGLEEFVNRCKERVLRYSAVQTDQSTRLGMWMDWDNSYFTMSDENNYTIWTFLKKCHERGFIYKGLDSMPWCPRCGTGISEQERKEGYKEVEDEAVFLKFPLRGRPNEFLLVWTTTPWTLAANVAAAVRPDITYVKVRQGDDLYYVAKSRIGVVESESKQRGKPELVEELSGESMLGWTYDGPFDELDAAAEAVGAHRVIAFDEVTESEGTGIVHIAPGCGKEDFDLSRTESLPVIAPIDESGIYVSGFGFLTGLAAGDVAGPVYESLQSKELFYKREKYRHDYPHCWRCQTPLLFRAVDEWYIDMSWREEIKSNVAKIRWIPEHGEAQEIDWLNNMGDWMISKKRYWGLALPIWECKSCGSFDVIGDRAELANRAVEGWSEFDGHSPHRPWIDKVKIACSNCGSLTSRIPDVGNPWLDAGIVPYSTVGYNADRSYWATWIPADFVVESFPGQFRNWFYALLAMSTMMENIAPFKTLLGFALVRDEQGEEFSKSRYFIEFNEAADRVGSDVMRWLYCRQNPTQNLNFGYTPLEQIQRKVFGTLWNTYLFFSNYARLDRFDPNSPPIPVAERPEIDRWILSNLHMLIESANEQFEQYLVGPFIRKAEEFIDELSNWYVRRNRQRFWDPRGKNELSKLAAYQTLHEVLVTLIKLLAPVTPFISERMYQNLVVEAGGPGEPPSVHLCDYPRADPSIRDESLSFQMGIAQQVTAAGHSLRESAGHRVRQPLAELRVAVFDDEMRKAIERLGSYAQEELNVKKISVLNDLGDLTSVNAKPNFASLGPRYGRDAARVAAAISALPGSQVELLKRGETLTTKLDGTEFTILPDDVVVHVETAEGWVVAESGSIQLALDTSLTEELFQEGLARDVVRHIQNLRRTTGLNIEDRVTVAFKTDDFELSGVIASWSDYICGETQCDALTPSAEVGGNEVSIAGKTLQLMVKKV